MTGRSTLRAVLWVEETNLTLVRPLLHKLTQASTDRGGRIWHCEQRHQCWPQARQVCVAWRWKGGTVSHTCGNGPRLCSDVLFAPSQVGVTGSFCGWKHVISLFPCGEERKVTIMIPPGDYDYKLIVDGVWLCDSSVPQRRDTNGNINNVLRV